jgi:hypothetical protein
VLDCRINSLREIESPFQKEIEGETRAEAFPKQKRD